MKRGLDIKGSLREFMVLRVVVATILLGAGGFLYLRRGENEVSLYLVCILALVYLFTLLYAVTYPFFKKRPEVLGGVQILLDIGLESAVIYVTGGKESPFVFLYALSIISSNIILTRAAGYGAAALSSLVYLSIVLYSSRSLASAESGGFFKSQTLWLDAGLAYALFEVCGFLLVALLSGYLSERLRLTRDELMVKGDDLRFLKNLNENVLQSLTSGLVTLDLGGKIISINRAAFEILRIDKDEVMLEKKVEDIIPNLNLSEGGLKKREEVKYRKADGRELILGFSSSPLRDTAGKICGHIIIFQDLTELKELERQVVKSEKMAMIGQLASGLAHEVRNPLSAISGAFELIGPEVPPSDDNERLLRVITQEIEKLNLLVEDFLIFARPVEPVGKDSDVVNLRKVIGEVVESFSDARARRGLLIKIEVREEVEVRFDYNQMKQVLWNLLINAAEAMPDGGRIGIHIRADGKESVIKISDEGHGMDEGLLARIFEPFFTTKDVGTGLGLAIVKKLVEGYGGRMSVRSEVGRGTTFTIVLPLVDSTESKSYSSLAVSR